MPIYVVPDNYPTGVTAPTKATQGRCRVYGLTKSGGFSFIGFSLITGADWKTLHFENELLHLLAFEDWRAWVMATGGHP